jgi:hypothetical protein
VRCFKLNTQSSFELTRPQTYHTIVHLHASLIHESHLITRPISTRRAGER